MIYVMFLLFLLIGFWMGMKTVPETVDKDVDKFVNKVKSVKKKVEQAPLKPGLYRRPTAKTLYNKNRPEREKEANEAMKKTLSEIPDIENQRKMMEER